MYSVNTLKLSKILSPRPPVPFQAVGRGDFYLA